VARGPGFGLLHGRPGARLGLLHGRPGARLGLTLLAVVLATSTLWYTAVEDFGVVDAFYQTVLTISTVGFQEVQPLDTSGRIFTVFVILVGVGSMLYTLTSLCEGILEEQVGRIGRRRVERRIAGLSGHVIVCGYGRVGRATAALVGPTLGVVVVDADEARARAATDAGFAVIVGDATDDGVLAQAGLDRARILAAALPTDADNLFVVLSGRARNPGLQIVARARAEPSEAKLLRAGADRVVNPQEIGARRMAAFALEPAVSDFLDVVMHGAGDIEYRLQDLPVPPHSPLAGRSIRDAHIRDHTGALVLSIRDGAGEFNTNPSPELLLEPGVTIIAIGTDDELERLHYYLVTGSIEDTRAAEAADQAGAPPA
jgi:voltage-gated potassium channel